jgi:hypothetical protein
MNFSLAASILIAGGFTLEPAAGVKISTEGISAVLSPTTVTGATTVTLPLTGVVEVDGSDGAGVEDPPPPPPPEPPLTALAVRAVADEEAAEVPMVFVAATEKVYEVPAVRFLMVQLVVALVQLAPEVVDAVYKITGDPPSIEGAVQETINSVVTVLVPLTFVGLSGLVIATTISGSTAIEIVTVPS